MNKTSHLIEEDSYGFFTKLYCFLHRVCKVDPSVCSCISTCSMLKFDFFKVRFPPRVDVVQYIFPYSYVFGIVIEIVFADVLIQ
jgi:hypothetical protein